MEEAAAEEAAEEEHRREPRPDARVRRVRLHVGYAGICSMRGGLLMSTPTNEELAERINRGLGITTTLAFRRDGLEALVELAARLRRAERLVKYAGCMNVCATVNGSGGDCDCGYVEAQMAYELRKEQVAGDTPNRKQVRDERDALRTRLAEVERERDNLRACNEAMREPMRLLRELASMPAEGESAVVERVVAMFRAATCTCEALARRCVEERDRQASRFPQHDERRTWLDLKASEAERIADAIRDRAKEQR